MVPVAAKAGVLLAVAAAGSTGVWYFSNSIFGTSLVSVADESDQAPYQTSSIGKKYGKYFLSSKDNKKIWEERYKEHKKRFATESGTNKAKDKFGTVASAYIDDVSNAQSTALNKICFDAYKETTSTNLVEAEPSGTSNTNQFVKRNIWKFCAIGDIVTVGEDSINYTDQSFGTSTIGGDTTNKKLFVSTKAKDNVNDWFWKLKTEEFWSGTPSLQGTDTTNNEFSKLKADKSKTGTSIKAACEEAYKKTSSTDTNHKNKEDALVFCSIKLELSSDA